METNNLKFLQIGLGSMGKRRIRSLLYNKIKKEQIYGFDISSQRCQETTRKYQVKTISNFQKAIKECNPNVFLISTPPELHHPYFLYAAKNKIHFFVDTAAMDKGFKKLFTLLDNTFVAAPCCTFRFFPAIKKIKKLINQGTIGKIQAFNYHNGQYLPNWHSWEDYRDIYLSKKETGACKGVMVFDLSWMIDIFNSKVEKISGVQDRVSNLEMSADDIFLANIKFKNGIVGNITIDCISRQPYKTLRLLGTAGTLDWDMQKYQIEIYKIKGKNPKPGTPCLKRIIHLKKGEIAKRYTTPTEDMYHKEMKIFLEAIEGKRKFPYTFKENHYVLKTMFALEKSSKTGKAIIIRI